MLEPAGLGVTLRADYLVSKGSDIECELLVESLLPGTARHVLRRQINLLGGTRVEKAVRDLAAKVELPKQHNRTWGQILEAFCESVIRSERRGEPAIWIDEAPDEQSGGELVERLLRDQEPTLFFGHSGTGKGWVSTGLTVCVQAALPFVGLRTRQANVLYLDWEDRPSRLKERRAAICAGLGVAPVRFRYRRMRGPLHAQVHQVAQEITEHGIGLLVVDSVEMAVGSTGDRATYEDATKRLFEALRSCGEVASWLIDHVNAEAAQSGHLATKAINSVMKMAWVRNAWHIRSDQEPGIAQSHVGLYHVKTNHSELYRPIGLRLDWTTPGRLVMSRQDVRESDKLREGTTGLERICFALRGGALGYDELEVQTGLLRNALRSYVERGVSRGLLVKLPDGHRVGLVEQGQHGRSPVSQGGTMRPVPIRQYRDVDDDAPF